MRPSSRPDIPNGSSSSAAIRDPLPPRSEGIDFEIIRQRLSLPDTTAWARPEALATLGPPDLSRVEHLVPSFFPDHNPYIRHIVRRSRDYLENTIDPQTNEPYLKPVRVRLFGEADAEALSLPLQLRDAYEAAEQFCELVGHRPGLNAGILKTLLLRRVGSSIYAGQRTAQKMMGSDEDAADEEEEDGSGLYPLTPDEREQLERFAALLEPFVEADPKRRQVETILKEGLAGTGAWLDHGCIIFSQYFDTVIWLAERLSVVFPDEPIGLYAGATRSGLYRHGQLTPMKREGVKDAVRHDEIRLLLGTDAASEGLNLQRLGTLINLDLPWNPTRLEQRKGRIQRIGQPRDEVLLYNMRYRDSVEDRVHHLLSERLENIHSIFGQLPDTLEDVWVSIALRDEEKAKQIIDAIPKAHPFEIRYDRIEQVDWESCATVLDSDAQIEALSRGW